MVAGRRRKWHEQRGGRFLCPSVFFSRHSHGPPLGPKPTLPRRAELHRALRYRLERHDGAPATPALRQADLLPARRPLQERQQERHGKPTDGERGRRIGAVGDQHRRLPRRRLDHDAVRLRPWVRPRHRQLERLTAGVGLRTAGTLAGGGNGLARPPHRGYVQSREQGARPESSRRRFRPEAAASRRVLRGDLQPVGRDVLPVCRRHSCSVRDRNRRFLRWRTATIRTREQRLSGDRRGDDRPWQARPRPVSGLAAGDGPWRREKRHCVWSAPTAADRDQRNAVNP